MPTYRQLDADAITQTVQETCDRIRERFPESNLRRLAEQLLVVSREAGDTANYLSQPNWPLRIGGGRSRPGSSTHMVSHMSRAG